MAQANRKKNQPGAGKRSRTIAPEISLLVPVLNEEDCILPFYNEAARVLREANLPFEIIFIDDGSEDRTAPVIQSLIQSDPSIKLIVLSRNFGKDRALSAGMQEAAGEYVCPIDVDLQDPPSLIPGLLKKARVNDLDAVMARRRCRKADPLLKRITAHLFYRALFVFSSRKTPHNVGDFCVMHRRLVNVINSMPEQTRNMKSLHSYIGYRTSFLDYDRMPRICGKSRWSYSALCELAREIFISTSAWPLRIWSVPGLLFSLAGLAGLLSIPFSEATLVTERLWQIAPLLFVGGVTLLAIVSAGEYILRILEEVRGRPHYIVMRRVGDFGKRSG